MRVQNAGCKLGQGCLHKGLAGDANRVYDQKSQAVPEGLGPEPWPEPASGLESF